MPEGIRRGNRAVDQWNPLPVNDMGAGTDRESVPPETVTFVGKAAAGSAGISALDKKPILNKVGDKVGSYWGKAKNVKYSSDANMDGGSVVSLVETALSATVVIRNGNVDLEKLFEEGTTSRFVARVYDVSGGSLYGFVGLVAKSGDDYTLDIHNVPSVAGDQSWVGTLADFNNLQQMKIEIYAYETSFAWVTGTVLTEEINYDSESKDYDIVKVLTDGQFAIDYEHGRILYRRATAGVSDTATYDVPASSTTNIGSIAASNNVEQINGVTVANDNAAGILPVVQIGGEYNAAAPTYDDGDAAMLQLDANGNLKVSSEGQGNAPQAGGSDVAGADAYVTLVTASADRHHMLVSLKGSNDAIVSLDGITDHFIIPANSSHIFDDIFIANAATVQAKNASAGNNYANISITIW